MFVLCNIMCFLFLILIFSMMRMNLPLKAGSIEGQVVEMGLITTSLLNAEKFPVIVPNSLFSSQVCSICFTFSFVNSLC